MQYIFKMQMIDSGALNLQLPVLETEEGIRTCKKYGKAIAEMFE